MSRLAIFGDDRAWGRAKATIRSFRELGPEGRAAFQKARATGHYQEAFDIPCPLVSVCIGTYNRARTVAERAVASVLAQSYPRFELIVVGDNCTDETAELMPRDPRLTFINLPRRGEYPRESQDHWRVAGTQSVNHALSLAKGEFITHLDDDDEMTPHRLASLVTSAKAWKADLMFHPFEYEKKDGTWELNEADQFQWGKVTTGSIFYHRWFRQIGWDPLAYRFGEPGDWNRLRKFKYLGANIVRSPCIMLRKFAG